MPDEASLPPAWRGGQHHTAIATPRSTMAKWKEGSGRMIHAHTHTSASWSGPEKSAYDFLTEAGCMAQAGPRTLAKWREWIATSEPKLRQSGWITITVTIPYFARAAERGEHAAGYPRVVRRRFVRDPDRRRAHSKPERRESAPQHSMVRWLISEREHKGGQPPD